MYKSQAKQAVATWCSALVRHRRPAKDVLNEVKHMAST